jgi:DNA-binding beta-propeller fold protein YncE
MWLTLARSRRLAERSLRRGILALQRMNRRLIPILATWAAVLTAGAMPAGAAGCPGAPQGCPYTGVALFGQQGAGVFRFPQAVAVDPQGDVWVADEYSSVVQRFSPQGRFLSQFGSYGSLAGELGAVGGLAVDRLGRILVLDSANDRVEIFTPQGALVRAWGTAGSGRGQFRLGNRSPVAGGGIASAGNAIYVADTFNDRIQKFTLDGRWVRTFGEGRLRRPMGLAATRTQVLVADDNNHRLVRFTPSGVLKRTGGSYGRGKGQLRFPYDVSFDARGNAWVADNIGGRVVVFDSRLRPKAAYGGFGTALGQFAYVRSLAVDPVLGRVYVADTANNRVQVLDVGGHVVAAWGVSGRGPGNLTDPSDVVTDGLNRLAVADTVADRVEVLDTSGNHLASLATRLIARPLGLGSMGGTDLVVSDTFHDRVVRLAPDGTIAAEIGTGAGSGEGQFHSPHGIARGLLGDFYIADTGNDRVQHFNRDGSFSGVIGGLSGPEDVAVDQLGSLFVADTRAGRIVKYSILGTVLARWTGFDRPSSIALGSGGTVYVSEAGLDRVAILDGNGRRRGVFGASGTLPGEFVRPGGLTVTTTGDLAVTDPRNNRLQLFTFGHAAPASTAPAQPTPPPPAPLTGRLLAPRSRVPVRRPLALGCRASQPGFCDVRVRLGTLLLARERISLPVAGSSRRAQVRVPRAPLRGRGTRISLTVDAVIRDGAGERVTDVATVVVTVPRKHRRKHRHK